MNPYMMIAAIASVGGSFAFGVYVGNGYASGRCDGRIYAEAVTATEVLNRKDRELEQCRSQVDEINSTVAEQGRKLSGLLAKDAKERRIAQAEAAARDRDLVDSQKRVREALLKLKDTINEADFGECAGSIVPDDLNRLLNDALAEGSGQP